jgi:aquaporin Z
MKDYQGAFFSEFIGTALLIAVGLSFVILNFGNSSPIVRLIPDAGLRRLITGFLFGSTGALIALSPLGKSSGAHINPVVTLAFWLKKKMKPGHAAGYVIAQFAGAGLGALPLLLWGNIGGSVDFGATIPGKEYGAWLAALGEFGSTLALIVLLFAFLGHKRLRSYTPLIFPILYAILVYLEAPLSGTSTNPARSFGPSLISGDWQDWWVYWIGPISGAVIGIGIHAYSWLNKLEVEVAKIYHFDHDPHGIFKKKITEEVESEIPDSV